MDNRTFTEDEQFGITYVMWFCRSCNVMLTSKHDHNVNRHPERIKNTFEPRKKNEE